MTDFEEKVLTQLTRLNTTYQSLSDEFVSVKQEVADFKNAVTESLFETKRIGDSVIALEKNIEQRIKYLEEKDEYNRHERDAIKDEIKQLQLHQESQKKLPDDVKKLREDIDKVNIRVTNLEKTDIKTEAKLTQWQAVWKWIVDKIAVPVAVVLIAIWTYIKDHIS